MFNIIPLRDDKSGDTLTIIAMPSSRKGRDGRAMHRLWNVQMDRDSILSHSPEFLSKESEYIYHWSLCNMFSDFATDGAKYTLTQEIEEDMLQTPTIRDCIKALTTIRTFNSLFNRKSGRIEINWDQETF